MQSPLFGVQATSIRRPNKTTFERLTPSRESTSLPSFTLGRSAFSPLAIPSAADRDSGCWKEWSRSSIQDDLFEPKCEQSVLSLLSFTLGRSAFFPWLVFLVQRTWILAMLTTLHKPIGPMKRPQPTVKLRRDPDSR